jgi:hypothetical protein
MDGTEREKRLGQKRRYWRSLSAERKAELAARRREKYNSDPEYRARIKEKEDRRRAQPGYAEYARNMSRKYMRRQREDPEYRAKSKARTIRFHRTEHGTAVKLIAAARGRAKRQGVAVRLTKEWVADKLAAGVCPKTGYKFTYRLPSEVGARKDPTRPSLDRVVPGGDYSEENVQVTCTVYNIAKQDLSDREFLDLCLAVVTCAGYSVVKGPPNGD